MQLTVRLNKESLLKDLRKYLEGKTPVSGNIDLLQSEGVSLHCGDALYKIYFKEETENSVIITFTDFKSKKFIEKIFKLYVEIPKVILKDNVNGIGLLENGELVDLYPKRCNISGEGFSEGFYINYSEEYIESEQDADKRIKELGLGNLKKSYKNGHHYYSQWSVDDIDFEEEVYDEHGNEYILVSSFEEKQSLVIRKEKLKRPIYNKGKDYSVDELTSICRHFESYCDEQETIKQQLLEIVNQKI